jgi:hypothetical protein
MVKIVQDYRRISDVLLNERKGSPVQLSILSALENRESRAELGWRPVLPLENSGECSGFACSPIGDLVLGLALALRLYPHKGCPWPLGHIHEDPQRGRRESKCGKTGVAIAATRRVPMPASRLSTKAGPTQIAVMIAPYPPSCTGPMKGSVSTDQWQPPWRLRQRGWRDAPTAVQDGGHPASFVCLPILSSHPMLRLLLLAAAFALVRRTLRRENISIAHGSAFIADLPTPDVVAVS